MPSIFEVPKESASTPVDKVPSENEALIKNSSLESVSSVQVKEIKDPDVLRVENGFVLENGFDLEENHYSKNKETDGIVELPIQRITNEESLMDDSESIGELSEVEVIFIIMLYYIYRLSKRVL